MASITQGGSDARAEASPFIDDTSGDILRGAAKIAKFLFGDPAKRRQVYYLVEARRLPVFRCGGICARKTTLLAWIAEQENFAIAQLRLMPERRAV